MRKALIIMAVFIMAPLLAPSVNAQQCGDVNNDGATNITDLLVVWEHIGQGNSLPIDTALIEFDGRRGITIGDGLALTKHLFELTPLVCGAAGVYTFPTSMSDTLFMPVMVSIPDEVTDITIPISFALDTATDAVFLPILPNQPSNMNHFDVSPNGMMGNLTSQGNQFFVVLSDSGQTRASRADTVSVQYYSFGNHQHLSSADTALTISYTRTEPGLGIISPIATDRSNILRVAIERNGELYSPVVATRLIQPPPDSLRLSVDALSFTFTAGKTVSDTFLVDITSNFGSLQFSVTTSDPWILLPNLPVTTPETPLSLAVTIDSTLVPIGVNTGFIEITPLDPTVIIPQNRIAVTAIANTPALFMTGDVDCNGIVDITDLTILISHLFINFTPLPVCQQ